MAGLTLSRKVNEQIYLGPDVTITVTRIGTGKVWLNIEAPPDMDITRDDCRLRPTVLEHRDTQAEKST